MNARTIRHTALIPLLTVSAGLLTAVSMMLTAGADAAEVPTPSDTTAVAVATATRPTADGIEISELAMTPPTGTAPTPPRDDLCPRLLLVEGVADRPVEN